MPSGLDSTDKLFMKHSSKPYNPKLAGVFFKSGMIEACGKVATFHNFWQNFILGTIFIKPELQRKGYAKETLFMIMKFLL